MYNSYGSGGVTSPPLTNNPFIDHTASTTQRYPDISQPHNVVMNGAGAGGGGQQYPQFQQQHQLSQFQNQMQPPQQQPWQTDMTMNSMSPMNSAGMQPQPTGYQMQSSFGQGAVSGTSYNYLNSTGQQPMQQQQTSYNPAQQQLQSPSYLAQFDPYAGIGQGWGETTTTTTTITANVTPSSLSATGTGSSGGGAQYFSSSHINTPVPSSNQPTSLSAAGDQHPREYIRIHKTLIESWDRFTWNTFLGLFEKLKSAWEARKSELDARVGVLNTQVSTLQMQTQAAGSLGYAGYLQVQQYQQEASRIQGLAKQAALNFDSVAASTFQMQEVFQNYRQSGDLASKKRVREATNASLQSLPDWPQPFV